MKKIFTLWLGLLAGGIAVAQSNEKQPWMPLESRIGLALGIGSATYLDKNTSPLIYKSAPKNVRLFYNLESKHFLFSVDLDLKVGGTVAKYQRDRTLYFQEQDYKGKTEDKKFPVGGSFLAGRIGVGMFYKIPSTQQSTFRVAVGGRIMNELWYPQGWTTGGIFNSLSLNPEAWVQHRIDEHHSFAATLRTPLLARLTRLPYDNTVSAPGESTTSGFFRHSRWVSGAKFLAPTASLSYNYQINSRWGAGVTYEWGWYRITTPQTFKATSQSLLASVYHQF